MRGELKCLVSRSAIHFAATMAAESDSRRPNLFSRIRTRTDRAFGRWADLVAARPWTVILATVLVIGAIAPGIRFLEVSTNTEEFLLPHHPLRIAYDEFRDQFGTDNVILITFEHEDLFSEDFLSWLRPLHEAIEDRVPYVDEVTSLINVRSTRGDGDELRVDDLLGDWPEGEEGFEQIEVLVKETPFHQRIVIGDDGRRTTLQIELQTYLTEVEDDLNFDAFDEADPAGATEEGRTKLGGTHEEEVVETIRTILAEFERPDVKTVIAGTPWVNVRIFQDMGRNLVLFLVLSMVAVSFVLAFVFRRASGVFLPLLVVSASLLGTMGVIGLRGAPVNMTIQIIPSFLLAVGCSSSIHLLVLFFQSYDEGNSRAEALRSALSHAGMPIALACATTAVGMMSFLVTDVAPVHDVGFMAPVGVGMGLTLCLILLPALLMVVPMGRRPPVVRAEPSIISRGLVAMGDFSVSRPILVLTVTGVVVAIALVGFVQVRFEHNALTWFPDSDPLQESSRITDTYMGGTASIELLIDTGRENGLHDPDVQRRLEAFEDEILNHSPVRESIRKIVSLNGVLREIHQALNENDPAFYTTPADANLIAQELLLFENSGSDDLEKVVDSSFQVARVSIRSVWGGGQFYQGLLGRIEAEAVKAFPDAGIKMTGIIPIIMMSMIESEAGMKESYALAFLMITPLMILLIGSLRGGLSSMVPNLAPIVIVVGIMGWFDIRFDVFTIMTGSIAIGLAVDDTIHFMHAFYREFERTHDTRASVRTTLETTGHALLTTSLVLSVGFSVFLFATMPTLRTFGFITTLAIILAFLADVLIAPALVTLATRHRTTVPTKRAA